MKKCYIKKEKKFFGIAFNTQTKFIRIINLIEALKPFEIKVVDKKTKAEVTFTSKTFAIEWARNNINKQYIPKDMYDLELPINFYK